MPGDRWVFLRGWWLRSGLWGQDAPSDPQRRLESRGSALDPRPENERTFGVRGHRQRVTGVQMRARCGRTEADPATLAPEATPEDALVSSDRRARFTWADWREEVWTTDAGGRGPDRLFLLSVAFFAS